MQRTSGHNAEGRWAVSNPLALPLRFDVNSHNGSDIDHRSPHRCSSPASSVDSYPNADIWDNDDVDSDVDIDSCDTSVEGDSDDDAWLHSQVQFHQVQGRARTRRKLWTDSMVKREKEHWQQ